MLSFPRFLSARLAASVVAAFAFAGLAALPLRAAELVVQGPRKCSAPSRYAAYGSTVQTFHERRKAALVVSRQMYQQQQLGPDRIKANLVHHSRHRRQS